MNSAELTNKPIFFKRNRMKRVYKGGYLFHDFLNDEAADSYYPEEWIASTVYSRIKNEQGQLEGLSVIENTDITLKELFEKNQEACLGKRKDMGILVKYLDSAIRLPLQAHPDRQLARELFDSEYGKTECWVIIATRDDACIYFGFKDKISKDEFSDLIEKSLSEKDIMESVVNKVEVKPGDVFLIPGKLVHAIGAGCLLLEIQEPTDYTISPEYWCGEQKLNHEQMYLNLTKEDALKCFDFNVYGQDVVEKQRKKPKRLARNRDYLSYQLIGEEDTPCFSLYKTIVTNKYILDKAPAIYTVISGSGTIIGDGYERNISKGDYFFLPAICKDKFHVNTSECLELIECLPPRE